MQGAERIQALEEAVRHLESARTQHDRIGDLDFEDARVAGLITTALSAARVALSAASQRENLVEDGTPNR